MDWNELLLDQLTFHWEAQARPRLDGLTDDEYRWEPVVGMWNIRPRGEARTSMAAGGGEFVADFEYPEPTPTPLTTIAWRLAHVNIGIFGMRNASHFGGPPVDYRTAVYPGTAAEESMRLFEAAGLKRATVKPRAPSSSAQSFASFTQPARSICVPG